MCTESIQRAQTYCLPLLKNILDHVPDSSLPLDGCSGSDYTVSQYLIHFPNSSHPCALSEVKVAQLCLTLCDPMDYIAHGILQARILEWVSCPSPGDLSNPGIKPRSSALQVDYLPAESKGKPKNTGVGRLFLLQQIFPTQESNWDLLNCTWILYQLSYQGSHSIIYVASKK